MQVSLVTPSDFTCHELGDSHAFFTGRLPDDCGLAAGGFDSLWKMHPPQYHRIRLMGRLVDTPRWQQAYGVDYYYTGRINRARPIPSLLQPLLTWAREEIDERLNGLLLNWYDGVHGHYIGKHRDSIRDVAEGVPIVTASYGEERIFRLRQLRAAGRKDFLAQDGSVFIMPYDTNLAWTHEVPHFKRYAGRRISVTLRGFVRG